MNVFITGASGFIGGHLAAALARSGANVRALIHRRRAWIAAPVEFVQGDLRDEELLADACRGIDLVFHCAAALGASQIGAKEFRSVNAGGTRALLEAARAAGVRRVVHFSSAGVLGRVENGRVADEDYPPAPRDVYDRTKLEGERIALEAARAGLDVVVIRPGWVYGPGDRRTLKLIRAISRRRFALVGKGLTLQTPVYIDDLVAGTLLSAEKGRSGEIYHLAGPEVLSVADIVTAIAAASGNRLPRWRLPALPTRAAAWLMGRGFGLFKKEAPLNPSRLAFFLHPKPLEIAKARRELGYDPATSFGEGMAKAVAWYRDAGWIG
jgi:dihydroflavonol-4-reductase